MIDVKDAISKAKAYAADLLGTPDLLLEEVRSNDDHFEITLSFPERGTVHVNPLVQRLRGPREYKTFNVSKQTGEVLAMSIRQIA